MKNILNILISFINEKSGSKYFYLRFIKIVTGDTINWINSDDRIHNLMFRKEIPQYGIKIGKIAVGKSLSKKFEHYVPRLDYISIHPEESGTIIIYPKSSTKIYNERQLYNKSKVFEFTDFHQQKNKKNIVSETVQFDPVTVHPRAIRLEKYLDPAIYSILHNENLYKIQSKNLTIVFWDLSGFSALCNHLKDEPLSITTFLKEYLDFTTKIIHKNNGVVDKFIGDGIMAYFGFKGNHSYNLNKEIEAVSAALEIQKYFEKIKYKWIKIWKAFGHINISLDVKCGLHSGEVLFGLLDTEERYQITIIGRVVNLANRLQDLAEENQIIISTDIKKLIENRFVIEDIELKEKIKAFPEIKRVHEVKGVLS